VTVSEGIAVLLSAFMGTLVLFTLYYTYTEWKANKD
jgi:hypothetical protein